MAVAATASASVFADGKVKLHRRTDGRNGELYRSRQLPGNGEGRRQQSRQVKKPAKYTASGPPVAVRWRVSGSLCPLRQFAREKIADDGCDLGPMAFERKMPGLEEVNLGVWIIPLEGQRPGRQEERI